MSGRPVCPQCGTPVEVDWEWCHACGFDPEGKRAAYEAEQAALGATPFAEEPPAAGSAFPGAPAPGSAPTPTPAPSLLDAPTPSLLDAPAPGGASFDTGRTDPFGTSDPFEPADPFGAPAPRDPFAGLGDAPLDEPSFEGGGAEDGVDPDHPYADLPYSTAPEPAAAPEPFASLTPPPANPGGFSPAPPFGGPSGAPGPGGGFVPGGPGGPGGPVGPGGPGGAPGSPLKANSSRIVIGVGIGVLVVALLAVVLIKVAGSSDSTTAADTTPTTVDPKAPKPIGEVNLAVPGDSATPSTLAGSPTASLPTGAAPTDGWVKYKAPDQSFLAEFPGQPAVQSATGLLGGQVASQVEVKYEIGTDGGGFTVQYLELPSGAIFPDSQSAFDKDVEYATSHKRPAPVQTGSQTVDGVTSVQFTLDVLGKTARGVYIIKGGRLYVLYAVDASDTDLARFLAAFHAIGK